MRPSGRRIDDESQDEAASVFQPPPLVRVAGASPLASWWAALAIGALVVLVVKPWGGDETRSRSDESRPSLQSIAIAPPASERAISQDEVIAAECKAPAGWRIYTIERWHEQTLRIWWAITPVVAEDPTDPRIPVLSIVAPNVPALGYCAPLFGPDRPMPGTVVRMWQTGVSASIREIRSHRLQPPFETPLLALYAPPGADPDRLDPEASWPTGRYLFSSGDRWFGVDLRIEPQVVPVQPGPPATGGDLRAPNGAVVQ